MGYSDLSVEELTPVQNLTSDSVVEPHLSADLLAIERLPRCRNCGYLRAAHSTCDICPITYTQADLDKGIAGVMEPLTWWR